MSPRIRAVLTDLGAITLVAFVFIVILRIQPAIQITTTESSASTTGQTASASGPEVRPQSESTPASTTPAPKPTAKAASAPVTAPKKSPAQVATSSSAENQAYRVQHPYYTPPLTFAAVNAQARSALVNIVCAPSTGSLRPISGSGIFIDPRGVILTNAHVAQYVLLSESESIDLTCVIRTGSPARPAFTAQVLYIPPVWVEQHGSEINQSHPTGTGEHDYALLLVSGAVDGSPLPSSLPYLAPDTRQAIGFVDDSVLVASYPAEYIGALAAQNDLYPATSITTIGDLLTFNMNSVDLISLGGVIEAQSGSSGGAVVNAWDRLIGVVTTTSDGATTAERDLRAVTLSYIDSDIKTQTGSDLGTILAGNVLAEAAQFKSEAVPQLLGQYLKYLSPRAQ